MHGTAALFGASSGVLTGSWSRAVVFRLAVPAGQPERTACRRCGLPLITGSWWCVPLPAGTCPGCRERIGIPPGPLEIAAGALLGLVAGVLGPRPELPAFELLALVAVPLATIDVIVHRLPDRLTLPSSVLLAALLGVAVIAGGEPQRLSRAVLAAGALAGTYLLLALLRPGELGLGDVKLAGVLGLALGWLGWADVMLATATAFAGCGMAGLALLLCRRVELGTALPLGPFMVAGTFGAVLVTPSW